MNTDFLFARPNFVNGIGTAIDLSGSLVCSYNRAISSQHADFCAIHSDWAMTGLDFDNALRNVDPHSNDQAE